MIAGTVLCLPELQQPEVYAFPDESEAHAYDITFENLLTKIPSNLLLNVDFLKFYYGETAFGKRDGLCSAELFPDILLPQFYGKIFIKRRCKNLVVQFRCRCDRPFSLFCQSLKTIIINKWMECLNSDMKMHMRSEPEPKLIYDISSHVELYKDAWFDIGNPMTALFQMLGHPSVHKKVTITRCGRNITIKIKPDHLPYAVSNAIELLKETGKKLPFDLRIECFPFIRCVVKSKK